MSTEKKKENKNAEGVVRNPFLACLLAWVFPGAGHVYLGKYWHALVFFVTEISLLVTGWLIGGELHSLLRDNGKEGFLQLLAAIGNLAIGILHFVFHFLGLGIGDIELRSHEYGTTFIIIAALINMLVVLNAYDLAKGEKE